MTPTEADRQTNASDFALEVVAKRALPKLSDQLDRASISAVLNLAEAMCSQCLHKIKTF